MRMMLGVLSGATVCLATFLFLHPFQLPVSMVFLYLLSLRRGAYVRDWSIIIALILFAAASLTLAWRAGSLVSAATQVENLSLFNRFTSYQPGRHQKSLDFSLTSYAALILPFGAAVMFNDYYQHALQANNTRAHPSPEYRGAVGALAFVWFFVSEWVRYFTPNTRNLNAKSDYHSLFDVYDPNSLVFLFGLAIQLMLGVFAILVVSAARDADAASRDSRR
jgi:hypothetical protein